ncbi:hypothetical protein Syun_019652 [Stephania yunnanensis]|uniref:Uncharacterized protein n=1 Tax=Stephania yunnanensis TaxID=152371 RepID=A0AAP0NY64_9MAGN
MQRTRTNSGAVEQQRRRGEATPGAAAAGRRQRLRGCATRLRGGDEDAGWPTSQQANDSGGRHGCERRTARLRAASANGSGGPTVADLQRPAAATPAAGGSGAGRRGSDAGGRCAAATAAVAPAASPIAARWRVVGTIDPPGLRLP